MPAKEATAKVVEKKADHFRQANGFNQGGGKKYQQKAGCHGVERSIAVPV